VAANPVSRYFRDRLLADAGTREVIGLEWVRRTCLPEEAYAEAVALRLRALARVAGGAPQAGEYDWVKKALVQAANTRFGEKSKGGSRGVIANYEDAIKKAMSQARLQAFRRADFWLDDNLGTEPRGDASVLHLHAEWAAKACKAALPAIKRGLQLAYLSVLLADDDPISVSLPARPNSPALSDDGWRRQATTRNRRPIVYVNRKPAKKDPRWALMNDEEDDSDD
jgi:hypothetical protein